MKIEVIKSIDQNGKVMSYVDYGDFCKMQSEYEEQIEQMKCCGNCFNRGLDKYMSYPCIECKIWHREKNQDYWELNK